MKQKIDVIAAIIVKQNKVFAARRKTGAYLAGLWEFPGGKLEDGETPEECLTRELQKGLHIITRVCHFVGESVYANSGDTIRVSNY